MLVNNFQVLLPCFKTQTYKIKSILQTFDDDFSSFFFRFIQKVFRY